MNIQITYLDGAKREQGLAAAIEDSLEMEYEGEGIIETLETYKSRSAGIIRLLAEALIVNGLITEAGIEEILMDGKIQKVEILKS